MTARFTRAEYERQLLDLLPPGAAWPRSGSVIAALLRGMAASLHRHGERVADIIEREGYPPSSVQLLQDWEAAFGLPDPCLGDDGTIAERQAHIRARMVAGGGRTMAWLQDLAASLGYEIAHIRYSPFLAGLGRCGDVLGGAPANRFFYRVRVIGPRLTLFRAGQSACGDRLGRIARADDLECRINRSGPAMAVPLLSYEGA